MPHVQVAVGIGRAVVEHIAGSAVPVGQHVPVDVVFRPELEGFRLFFPEVGLHGKGGMGELQGLFIIAAHGVLSLRFCPAVRATPEKPPV